MGVLFDYLLGRFRKADSGSGAPGPPGAPGADGDSAYEIAVANGFVGTEAQWLTSLEGADGVDGTNGTNGTNGTDGADGQDGVAGLINVDEIIGPITTHSSGTITNVTHADLATGNWLQFDIGVDIEVHGIEHPPDTSVNQLLWVSNNHGSKKVKLKNNSGSADTDCKFRFKADITLEKYMGITLVYDSVGNYWRCVSQKN